jgi:phosphate starvation-inducible PhoH-like protein
MHKNEKEVQLPSKNLTVIEDPEMLSRICGPNDINLKELELLLDARVYARGNQIYFESGDEAKKKRFDFIMNQLLTFSVKNRYPDRHMIRSLNETWSEENMESFSLENHIQIRLNGKEVIPRTSCQKEYIKAMSSHDIVFGMGPAGTGKTWLAIAQALSEILGRKKKKLILTRPVVEAGENLGFLPGELTDKLAPYLRPLYDAIEDFLTPELITRLKENNLIEVAPLAYMRGRTLKNSFIVLDEAQNTTAKQMKMFLTRLGEGSRAVITGDPSQTDLPKGVLSGLDDARTRLKGINDIAIIEFTRSDVMRHPLVEKIIEAYEKN